MFSFIKSSFLFQFAAGFTLGALGLVAVHASPAKADVAPVELAQR